LSKARHHRGCKVLHVLVVRGVVLHMRWVHLHRRDLLLLLLGLGLGGLLLGLLRLLLRLLGLRRLLLGLLLLSLRCAGPFPVGTGSSSLLRLLSSAGLARGRLSLLRSAPSLVVQTALVLGVAILRSSAILLRLLRGLRFGIDSTEQSRKRSVS